MVLWLFPACGSWCNALGFVEELDGDAPCPAVLTPRAMCSSYVYIRSSTRARSLLHAGSAPASQSLETVLFGIFSGNSWKPRMTAGPLPDGLYWFPPQEVVVRLSDDQETTIDQHPAGPC